MSRLKRGRQQGRCDRLAAARKLNVTSISWSERVSGDPKALVHGFQQPHRPGGWGGVILVVAGSPALAQVDCDNLPTSTGAVPQDVVDACFTAREATIGAKGPTDIAWGPESIRGSLDSMTLNAPDVLSSVGAVEFTPLVAGCDFANNDFTQLYCSDVGNSFFSLSTTDATKTVIGALTPAPPNGEGVSGMAWDGTTSTMYLCTSDGFGSSLLMVDLASGATTLVGTITGAAAIIACAADANGDLYGYDVLARSSHQLSSRGPRRVVRCWVFRDLGDAGIAALCRGA